MCEAELWYTCRRQQNLCNVALAALIRFQISDANFPQKEEGDSQKCVLT